MVVALCKLPRDPALHACPRNYVITFHNFVYKVNFQLSWAESQWLFWENLFSCFLAVPEAICGIQNSKIGYFRGVQTMQNNPLFTLCVTFLSFWHLFLTSVNGSCSRNYCNVTDLLYMLYYHNNKIPRYICIRRLWNNSDSISGLRASFYML